MYQISYLLIFFAVYASVAKEQEDLKSFSGDLKNTTIDKLLSRNRRYLVFPEGSSLQLVYDQIIPVIDLTNIYIMGVTVALAWRLPDRPHFAEHHAQHRKTIKIDQKQDKINQSNLIKENRTKNTDNDHYYNMYYNRSSYHDHNIDDKYKNYLLKKTESDYWKKSDWHYSIGKKNISKKIIEYNKVYPALRMRRQIEVKSVQNSTDIIQNSIKIHPEVKHYLNHHRNTRFDLYKSIVSYLNARGEHGEQCIQRSICETTKKQHTESPQSFIKEIMRVIFSLPLGQFNFNRNSSKKEFWQMFDDAQDINNLVDCQEKYPKCSNSVWSKTFVF